MDKPLVSIIVIVYNTANLLSRCLDSLINQSLKNIEIICVNDGSTDNSLSVLLGYAQKDPRIKIITQVNLGRGAAYNSGLKMVKGDYIGFIDSDDYADSEMYDQLSRIIKLAPNIDFVKSNSYIAVLDNQQTITQTIPPEKCNKIITDLTEIPELVSGHVSHWTGLYRRDFLTQNGIFFDDNQKFVPDIFFMYQIWLQAKRAIIVSKPYVFYQKNRPGSAVQSKDRISWAFLNEYKTITQFMKQKNISKKIWCIKSNAEFKHLIFEWNNRCNKKRWIFLKELSILFRHNLKKKYITFQSFKNKILYYLISYFPSLVFLNDKLKIWVAYYGYSDTKKYRFFPFFYIYETEFKKIVYFLGFPIIHRCNYDKKIQYLEQKLNFLEQNLKK